MFLLDMWAIIMAVLIGVVGRKMGYLNGRFDRCCW